MEDAEFKWKYYTNWNPYQTFWDGQDAASMKCVFPDIRPRIDEVVTPGAPWYAETHMATPLRDPFNEGKTIPHPTLNWLLAFGIPLLNVGAVRDFTSQRGNPQLWICTNVTWSPKDPNDIQWSERDCVYNLREVWEVIEDIRREKYGKLKDMF